MMIKKTGRLLLHLLYCMTAAIMITGCIKDDLADCGNTCYLTVRAYTQSGTELGADQVQDVSLFIFDSSNRFIQNINSQVGRRIEIDAPAGEDIHIVAWGNLSHGGQTYSQPEQGDLLADCFVELQQTQRTTSYVLSPGDLFRGQITIEGDDLSGDKILPIYRQVGSMAITVHNLKEFTGFADDDYSIIVRETGSGIGFDGHVSGDRVAYLPVGTFVSNNGKEEYRVPAFSMLPEDTGMYIDIYYGAQLLVTVSQNNTGLPIKIEKDKLTNVTVSLNASTGANVSVSVNDWGNYAGEKEF